MSKLGPLDHIDCKNILKHWIEFQLVDEQGKPLVNMPYRLKVRGNPLMGRKGVTDGNGLLREEDMPPHPV
ncbi:lipase family protein, partial [Photorhabdus heterorhabditis subsp. aluminescens]|nr:lipase family protein [Photorhabdus heterorhabditis subsp. aluminescens]